MRGRERQSVSRGGAERVGDTEPEASSRIWAVSTEPNMTLEPRNHEIMTWAKAGHSTDWATQAPLKNPFWIQTIWMWKLCLNYKVQGCLGGSVNWASHFGSGHDLTAHGFEPHIRLCANSSEPGARFRFCVSLSLCPSPFHALSLFVPKINKRWKKN